MDESPVNVCLLAIVVSKSGSSITHTRSLLGMFSWFENGANQGLDKKEEALMTDVGIGRIFRGVCLVIIGGRRNSRI